jgi:hypothetical protein
MKFCRISRKEAIMQLKCRFVLFGLIALALVLGIIAFDPGIWTRTAFAQGPKPTPPKSSKAPAASVGTAFTYQGQLKNGGAPVNGNCYLQFNLYSDSGGSTLVAGPVNGSPNPVSVTNGLFTVQIDFGSGAFQGDARWLRTSVKCGSDSAFTPLSLQPLSPSPYSLFSMKTAWGQTMTGSNVGMTAISSDWIGLAGVATSSPFLTPFTLGMSGVYGRGDDVGVWGESLTSNGKGVEGLNPASNNYGQLGLQGYGVYGASPGGTGVGGINSNSGNFGWLGDSSAGARAYGMGSGSDGIIALSLNGGNGVTAWSVAPNKSAVYGWNTNSGIGVEGDCSGSGCLAVYSHGDARVTGNLQVDGQATGFFPRPAYDSGIVWLSGSCSALSHNLGGNVQNYVVDIVNSNSTGTIMSNQDIGGWYNGDLNVNPGNYGFWYGNLNSTSVTVCRGDQDYGYVRLRIWVYK